MTLMSAVRLNLNHYPASAKFWLNPVSLARNLGLRASDLREVERLIRDHQTELLEAWNGYFGVGG
jgi:hypothetical protein